MRRPVAFLLLLLAAASVCAQGSANVLFIGNSYTEVNNLPQMTARIANSMGDNISYASNTPGGCTFAQHCSNQSMELIRQGGWDVVVLQEQSQYPSFPQHQVESEVFPFAERLVDSIYANNPCAEPMFYMTWGRKNGDQQNAPYFPVLGTYEGMDSMLCERYTYMAQTNDASLCPVGQVWRFLRKNSDIELYQSDGSHPSLAGTYAAACAFYTLIFHRDPDSIAYSPDGIAIEDAATIRYAVREVVFEQLRQWQRVPPKASFTIDAVVGNNVVFYPQCSDADSLWWDFGDGTRQAYSTNQCQTSVNHHYELPGTYLVTFTASRHCMSNSFVDSVTINAVDMDSPTDLIRISIYPNPTCGQLNVVAEEDISLITIHSGDGRELLRLAPSGNNASLSIAHLPRGHYLVSVVSSRGTATRLITKTNN